MIYLIKTPISKQFSGFRLILKDLFIVKDVIKELKIIRYNGVSSIIKQSLSFYAVITYGKCFAEASGRGTQLSKRDALKYANEEARVEHERIIDQRNNYVAHGSLKGYEHNPVVAALNPDQSDKKITMVFDNLMGLVDIDSQLDNFDALVNAVIKYVGEKTNFLKNKIENKLKEENLDSLYKEALSIEKLEEINKM